MDQKNREQFGKGGLGVDVMTGVAMNVWPHTWWAALFGLGALLAAWGFAPSLAAIILGKRSASRRKEMVANVVMGLGVFVFLVGAVWSAAMAGPEKPAAHLSAPPQPMPTSIHQQGGQSGNITNNGPVYNAPVTYAPVTREIHKPAPPSFKTLRDIPARLESDGTFIVGAEIKVISDSPPNNMAVLLKKTGKIVRYSERWPFQVMKGGSLSAQMGDNGPRYWVKIPNPSGTYTVSVRVTDANEKPEITILFNVDD